MVTAPSGVTEPNFYHRRPAVNQPLPDEQRILLVRGAGTAAAARAVAERGKRRQHPLDDRVTFAGRRDDAGLNGGYRLSTRADRSVISCSARSTCATASPRYARP